MVFFLRRLILILLILLMSPLLAAFALTLLFFNLIHLSTRFTRKRPSKSSTPCSGLASVIILNWNGKDLLARGLPSVLEAVRADGRPHEVMVVDNGSTDGSQEFLRREFPQVRLIALPENVGFAEGNNAGVRAAAHDVVVLLNNDMIVDRGFLRPLLDGFGPRTFAVTSQIFLQDPHARREETGKTTAHFLHGMISYGHCPLEGKELLRPYYPVFWAGGGSSAFSRERFLMLGGFQAVFSPAYVEDTDLSYQAWKMGWEVLFAPASIVHHKHRASSSRRFKPMELETLIQRNQFLFLWKNIRSWRLLLSHACWLPWTCYRIARDCGMAIWLSLLHAIIRLPSLEIARLGAPLRAVRTDHEIFELFSKPGLYFALERRLDPPASDSRNPKAPEAAQHRVPFPPNSDPGHLQSNANGRLSEGTSDNRPQILWVTAYLPYLGRHAGAGRMYQLLKRITPDFRISLLTFLENEEEREYLAQVEPLCDRVMAMRRIPPLRWQLYAYEPFEEFNTPQMAQAVHDFLENRDYDLIQLEYSQMGCYADRAYRIPTLLTKHEVDFAACLRRASLERIPWSKVRWFYNYLQVLEREVRLTRRSDGVICMIDSDARELRKFCGDIPIHVINTGVDLDYFRTPQVPPSETRMVFVGAFQHLPNVDAMLYFCREIFPLIRKQIPDAQLSIVGSGPPPMITSLAELPGIEVTGLVPDIRPYMARSSVYVVPLRLGVGIRGKILEAWGMSMAVVASSVACAGLRCEDERNLLLADSAERFAHCVVALFRNPDRRKRLGAEGRKTAEQYYGWDAAAANLKELYQAYMKRVKPRSSEIMTMSQQIGVAP